MAYYNNVGAGAKGNRSGQRSRNCLCGKALRAKDVAMCSDCQSNQRVGQGPRIASSQAGASRQVRFGLGNVTGGLASAGGGGIGGSLFGGLGGSYGLDATPQQMMLGGMFMMQQGLQEMLMQSMMPQPQQTCSYGQAVSEPDIMAHRERDYPRQARSRSPARGKSSKDMQHLLRSVDHVVDEPCERCAQDGRVSTNHYYHKCIYITSAQRRTARKRFEARQSE